MKIQGRRAFLFLIATCLILNACGNKTGSPADLPSSEVQAPPGASKELGLGCLRDGDLGCAKNNYCSFHGDSSAGLRCCLASFLQTYFSENTQALGRMLGYDPATFAEIRGQSREVLLQKKALPFAELILLSEDQAPSIKELLHQWGSQLVLDQALTAELMDRIGRLGSDLQETVACLDQNLGSFKSDAVEKEVFQSDLPLDVAPRDLFFLKFVLGSVAYATQAVSPYDLGAEHFPSWPPGDEFLRDVNGEAGEEDSRFGELTEAEANAIAKLHPMLVQAFAALKSFSALKGSPSKVDAYLNWRYSPEFQAKASEFLKAVYASLQSPDWTNLETGGYQIRLSALAKAAGIPDSSHLPQNLSFLVRDAEGNLHTNGEFLKLWAAEIVRAP